MLFMLRPPRQNYITDQLEPSDRLNEILSILSLPVRFSTLPSRSASPKLLIRARRVTDFSV